MHGHAWVLSRLAPLVASVELAAPVAPVPLQALLDAGSDAEASGDTAAATSAYEGALKEATALGEKHELHAHAMFSVASFFDRHGRAADAEAVYVSLVPALERQGSPEVVSAYELLAELQCARGAAREAQDLLARSIAAQRRLLGREDHQEIANSYRDLGRCLAENGLDAEATEALASQLRVREALHGAGSAGTVPALVEAARHHAARGRTRDAAAFLEKAVAACGRASGLQAEMLESMCGEVRAELAALSRGR